MQSDNESGQASQDSQGNGETVFHQIDAANFAGAVAHVAAARLFGLLSDPDERMRPDWMVPGNVFSPEYLQDMIDDMAGYVGRHDCRSGEELWRHLCQGYEVGDADGFHVKAKPVKAAFELFVETARHVHRQILHLQIAEASATGRPSRYAAELKREDSIFQDSDGLGDLDDARMGAEKLAADREKKRQEGADAKKRKLAAGKQKQAEKKANRKKPDMAEELAAADDAPLSAGATPAGAPDNSRLK